MNTLYSTGQTIQIANSQEYTLKDDEVCINAFLYKKVDLEIITDDLLTENISNTVKVGINKRGGSRNIPAIATSFRYWQIDGDPPATLADCITNITNSIYPL